ncbi:MAG TPA: Panacea domain-containing protein [Candidatus Paceibacterota bacterium]|nr:Panacea domain-containing protein [Candidatus Paceibacterota bacterium]
MPINIEKYKNTILYLANKLGGTIKGKKKLAKLLYFVDFDFFEKYENSITGTTYKHLPMGPVPSNLIETLDLLKNEGSLDVKIEDLGESLIPMEVYTAKIQANREIFNQQEIEMLDRIINKYGGLNGGQLEQLSHAEAPFNATKLGEEIPYELSFYRETDFSVNA